MTMTRLTTKRPSKQRKVLGEKKKTEKLKTAQMQPPWPKCEKIKQCSAVGKELKS